MKRSPLRRMSRKRRRLLARRREVVREVHERDQVCQGAERLPLIACRGPLDVHELAPRSVDCHGWLIPERTVLLCRRHHAHVTDYPLEAHSVGLHKFSWEILE